MILYIMSIDYQYKANKYKAKYLRLKKYYNDIQNGGFNIDIDKLIQLDAHVDPKVKLRRNNCGEIQSYFLDVITGLPEIPKNIVIKINYKSLSAEFLSKNSKNVLRLDPNSKKLIKFDIKNGLIDYIYYVFSNMADFSTFFGSLFKSVDEKNMKCKDLVTLYKYTEELKTTIVPSLSSMASLITSKVKK